jgi:hypothetical protein
MELGCSGTRYMNLGFPRRAVVVGPLVATETATFQSLRRLLSTEIRRSHVLRYLSSHIT